MKTILSLYLLINFMVYGFAYSSSYPEIKKGTYVCKSEPSVITGVVLGLALFMADNTHFDDVYCSKK